MQLDGAVGDHFVGVHVGRRAGAGLKDIDDEFLVVPSVNDLARRGAMASAFAPSEQAEIVG